MQEDKLLLKKQNPPQKTLPPKRPALDQSDDESLSQDESPAKKEKKSDSVSQVNGNLTIDFKALYNDLVDPEFNIIFGINKDVFVAYWTKYKDSMSEGEKVIRRNSSILKCDPLHEYLSAFFYCNLRMRELSNAAVMKFIENDKEITQTSMQYRLDTMRVFIKNWKSELDSLKKNPDKNIMESAKRQDVALRSSTVCKLGDSTLKNYISTWLSSTVWLSPPSPKPSLDLEKEYERFINQIDNKARRKVALTLKLERFLQADLTAAVDMAPIPIRSKPTIDKPYFVYTNNLDMVYRSKKSPDKSLFVEGNKHHLFLGKLEKSKRESLKVLNDVTESTNFVIATISFIISAAPLTKLSTGELKCNKLKVVTFTLEIPKASVGKPTPGESKSFYDRKDFDDGIYISLIKRLKYFHEKQYKVVGAEKEKLNSQADYHSEVALYAYLMELSTIENLSVQLKEYIEDNLGGYKNGYRLYAVVIDERSTNNMCQNCSPLSYGLLKSSEFDEGFVSKLQKKLCDMGFTKGNKQGKVRFIIRYSSEQYSDQKPSDEYSLVLDGLEDAQVKDIKSLYEEDLRLLHAKDDKYMSKLEIDPNARFTIFFSGNQFAREKERALEERNKIKNPIGGSSSALIPKSVT